MLRVTKYCALRFAFTFLPKRGPSTEVGTVFEPWCPQAQSTIQERTRNIAVVPRRCSHSRVWEERGAGIGITWSEACPKTQCSLSPHVYRRPS